MNNTYQIWTDGSVMEEVGAWGILIKSLDSSVPDRELSGVIPNASSSRMELMAVCEAIRATPIGSEVQIFTDSTYIAKAFEKGWLYQWANNGWVKPDGTPVSDIDLWATILKDQQCRLVTATWVKSHSGQPDNERADIISRLAASNYLSTPERARKNIPLDELAAVKWNKYPDVLPPLNGTEQKPDFCDSRRYLVTLVGNKPDTEGRTLVREMVYYWRAYKTKSPARQWQNHPRRFEVTAWAELPQPFGDSNAQRDTDVAQPEPTTSRD